MVYRTESRLTSLHTTELRIEIFCVLHLTCQIYNAYVIRKSILHDMCKIYSLDGVDCPLYNKYGARPIIWGSLMLTQ